MIDVVIIIFIIFSVYRGREIGFARQALSTIGFFGGLFLGAWLQPHIISQFQGQTIRSLFTILTTLGIALLGMTLGEYIGVSIKQKVKPRKLNLYDNGLGMVLAVASLLFSVWLLAAVTSGLSFSKLNSALQRSHIVKALNQTLPDAPTVISGIAHLIDPNGFPKVFIGNEPTPRSDINLPALGDMRPAVEQARDSVVKIEGEGCGGVVDGSGFIAKQGFVVTNAHVVAGIANPYVKDASGGYKATVVWFDPDLDLAVLRVSGLDGKPLELASGSAPAGTPGAVLGYPNGGAFGVSLAAILDQFTATGRNIYDRGNTERDVYEIRATVVPGNSGGPLIGKDGKVLGVIFAQSTTHEDVGYALTNSQVRGEIDSAVSRNRVVSTAQCTAD
jgi:S1-C subfamily serine protease